MTVPGGPAARVVTEVRTPAELLGVRRGAIGDHHCEAFGITITFDRETRALGCTATSKQAPRATKSRP